MLSKHLTDLYNRVIAKSLAPSNNFHLRRPQPLKFRDMADDKYMIHTHGNFLSAFKTMRYGTDYAIDFMHQRQLEYSIYSVVKEIKIGEGKLLEGPARLLQTGIPFPTLTNLASIKSYSKGHVMNDESLTYRSFTRPTLLHLAFGPIPFEIASVSWQKLIPVDAVSEINELTLHNFQGPSGRILSKYHVRRISRAIGKDSHKHFYGTDLVSQFMPTLDIRNHYLNYVMLIDRRGHICWMSSWKPSEYEKSVFPHVCYELAKR